MIPITPGFTAILGRPGQGKTQALLHIAKASRQKTALINVEEGHRALARRLASQGAESVYVVEPEISFADTAKHLFNNGVRTLLIDHMSLTTLFSWDNKSSAAIVREECLRIKEMMPSGSTVVITESAPRTVSMPAWLKDIPDAVWTFVADKSVQCMRGQQEGKLISLPLFPRAV
jgi:predicted ATP-dependent serine protease